MEKNTIAQYVEKGFYAGAAATVGLIVVAAAPEIAIGCVVGVVAYKAVERTSDTISNFRAFCKERKAK